MSTATASEQRVLLSEVGEGRPFYDPEQRVEGTVRLRRTGDGLYDVRLVRYAGPKAGPAVDRVAGTWLVVRGNLPLALREEWRKQLAGQREQEQAAMAVRAVQLVAQGFTLVDIGKQLHVGEEGVRALLRSAATAAGAIAPVVGTLAQAPAPEPTAPAETQVGAVVDAEPRDREAVRLRGEGHTFREIAERLGYPDANHAKKAVYRAARKPAPEA